MHELRHSAIDEIRRQTGDIVAAMQLARHESVATTQTYFHPTQEDLIARMREVRWWECQLPEWGRSRSHAASSGST